MNRRVRFIALFSVAAVALLTASVRAELTTNKTTYLYGETVEFTLSNDSPDEMAWSSISHYPTVWRQLPDGEEEVVLELPLFTLAALGALAEGDTTTWEWDQKDYFQWYDEVDWLVDPRAQVEPGAYVARFETATHGVFETPEFEITDIPLPVKPKGKAATTWAALKGR